MSLVEAAQYVGLPPHQLRIWASLKVGPKCTGSPYRRSGLEYEKTDLDEWLRNAKENRLPAS